ncbi:MAG: hypothetical protein Q9224_007512, partial [Gallowayella concinna]
MVDETGPRLLRTRSKTVRAVRQEHGNDDIQLPLANIAAHRTSGSGMEGTTAAVRQEAAPKRQPEPIAIGDSDDEDVD